MARGQPDFGAYTPLANVSGVSDMAELAVRLGAPVSQDRQGQVIYLDTFERSVLQWTADLGGAGASAAISEQAARSGGFSCKLVAGTDGDHDASIYKTLAPPALSRIGVEVFWTYPAGNLVSFKAGFSIVVDGKKWEAYIKFTAAGFNYAYWDGAAYQGLTPLVNPVKAEGCWHGLKVVIDLETDEYVRLVADNYRYDLSGIDVPTSVVVATSALRPIVTLEGTAGLGATNYVDDLIVTQNEP